MSSCSSSLVRDTTTANRFFLHHHIDLTALSALNSYIWPLIPAAHPKILHMKTNRLKTTFAQRVIVVQVFWGAGGRGGVTTDGGDGVPLSEDRYFIGEILIFH